jgi:hypothetical protein
VSEVSIELLSGMMPRFNLHITPVSRVLKQDRCG